eukprot:3015517-Rhodomonas_salina.1
MAPGTASSSSIRAPPAAALASAVGARGLGSAASPAPPEAASACARATSAPAPRGAPPSRPPRSAPSRTQTSPTAASSGPIRSTLASAPHLPPFASPPPPPPPPPRHGASGGAPPARFCSLDRAAHRRHQIPHDRKPQPRPAGPGLRLPERLPDLTLLLLWHTFPGVRDRDRDLRPHSVQARADLDEARRRELDRVPDEVHQDLRDARRVRLYRREVLGDRVDRFNALGRHRAAYFKDVADELVEVTRFVLEHQHARSQRCSVQDVVDQRRQRVAARLDQLEDSLGMRAQSVIAHQAPRQREDRVQRRSELMRRRC